MKIKQSTGRNVDFDGSCNQTPITFSAGGNVYSSRFFHSGANGVLFSEITLPRSCINFCGRMNIKLISSPVSISVNSKSVLVLT